MKMHFACLGEKTMEKVILNPRYEIVDVQEEGEKRYYTIARRETSRMKPERTPKAEMKCQS
jgi:hypothetical protein